MINIFSIFDQFVLLHVKVTPKASKNKIGVPCKINDNQMALKIYVCGTPEDGKANQAVIDLLAKEWDLTKNQISIEQGEKSRIKVIKILAMPSTIINKYQNK